MIPRSYLYVPADRPDMLEKAARGAADAIIADLEDGVAASRRDEARDIVSRWPQQAETEMPCWVRVNNEPERMADDIAAAVSPAVAGIYVPKATPDSVASAVDLIAAASNRSGLPDAGFAVVALIESAEGLAGIHEIAAMSLVSRLAIGEADLGADLGFGADSPESDWLPIRLQLVIASAAARLDPPVGPVLTDFRNDDLLLRSTKALKRIGFGGRAAIHPQQVAVINDVFTPTSGEVAAARDLVARFTAAQEAGSGVMISDDGTMADEATVRRARRVIAAAEAAGRAR